MLSVLLSFLLLLAICFLLTQQERLQNNVQLIHVNRSIKIILKNLFLEIKSLRIYFI